MSIGSDIWTADVEIREIEVVGQRWPLLQIERFERNMIGERRYVGSEILTPDENGQYGRDSGTDSGSADPGDLEIRARGY